MAEREAPAGGAVGGRGPLWSGPTWHLPGLSARPGPELEGRTPAGGLLRAPALDAREAGTVAETVRRAALRARRERRISDVVDAISRAARRLRDTEDPAGRAAAGRLVADLGWSPDAVGATLAGMAESWTGDALAGLLRAELGDPAVLDGFTPDPARPGRLRRALGPPLLFQVQSGNVPGIAVTGIVRGLLARSGVLAKSAEDESALPALFAGLLAAEDPLLGACLAVTWWPGDETSPAFDAWTKRAGKVVVYGGDAAVSGLRRRVDAGTGILQYGPRTGLAVLLADAPAGAAAALARDVCAYEQRGCVSPRICYVVGADPIDWGRRLGEALEAENRRIPAPRPGDAEAVALRAARAEIEFAGFAGPGGREPETEVLGPATLDWTVLTTRGPGLASRGLPRAVWVYGVAGVDALIDLLAPLEGRVQAIGYAGTDGLERLADGAAELGVSRLAPIGTMAWPPADWRHEGRFQLLPLLDWTDWEVPS